MNTERITCMEGFDRNGIHCSSAELMADCTGRWAVSGRGSLTIVGDEWSARHTMEGYGAVIITESDGKKE